MHRKHTILNFDEEESKTGSSGQHSRIVFKTSWRSAIKSEFPYIPLLPPDNFSRVFQSIIQCRAVIQCYKIWAIENVKQATYKCIKQRGRAGECLEKLSHALLNVIVLSDPGLGDLFWSQISISDRDANTLLIALALDYSNPSINLIRFHTLC
jgi:hypothetical protein